jgi:hypothetical protein
MSPILQVELRFQHMESRFEHIDARFHALDQKLDLVRSKLGGRRGRIERLDEKVSRQFVWPVGIQIAVLLAVVGALLRGYA